MTFEEIKAETAKDKMLQKIAELVRSGQWHTADKTLKSFISVKDELTADDSNLILRSNRIVIPDVLQNKVLTLACEGHQGIVRTKALLWKRYGSPTLTARQSLWSKIVLLVKQPHLSHDCKYLSKTARCLNNRGRTYRLISLDQSTTLICS